jgi:sulfur carrier protein ThiS adenylyltransferase
LAGIVLNTFEAGLRKYLSAEQIAKIQRTTIGIAGAGGLGSNCASMLVRSGFKKITIVDMDEIETSNLNRQNYFLDQVGTAKVEALAEILFKINPDLELNIINKKVDEANINELFHDCSILIEAFDKPAYKTLFVETFVGKKEFVVAVSGLAGFGNSDRIKTHKIRNDFCIVGDLKSGIDHLPPLAPGVTIAAAKQVDLVLEHVIG